MRELYNVHLLFKLDSEAMGAFFKNENRKEILEHKIDRLHILIFSFLISDVAFLS